MTYEHLHNTLVLCYLAPNIQSIYAGRWDVWLIQNGYMEEFMHLTLKTDEQLKSILERAKTRAIEIKNSPLHKALL